MKADSELRAERGEFLRPLYRSAGPIQVTIREESVEYSRGDVTVEGPVGDTWVYEHLVTLAQWTSWLKKARIGTLRWLAAQEGQLSAGDLRTTASVRSQLARAGLIKPSHFWGDQVTEDGYRLALWARFEVDRRQG